MLNSQEKCVPKMCPIITHFKILAFFSPYMYFVVMQFYYKMYDVPLKFARKLIYGGPVHLCHRRQ